MQVRPGYGQPGYANPAYGQPGYGPSPPGYGPPPGQPGYGQPIMGQPMAMGGAIPRPIPARVWMPAPTTSVANCPQGLEYLANLDQIIVHEVLNVVEVLTGYDMSNKYEIKNSVGQNCYFAVEVSDFCARQCLGAAHPFEMKVLDNMGREVMRAYRPYRCQSCLCPCCLQVLTVEAPPGNVIGRVEEECTCNTPTYRVCDAEGNMLLRIEGPCCMCQCWSDIVFQVKSVDNAVEVGRITRQWPGFFNEFYTNVENFGVSFPMDLDVKCKATLLGATFLIDFMFFEDYSRRRENRVYY